jgi:hypothetical protein
MLDSTPLPFIPPAMYILPSMMSAPAPLRAVLRCVLDMLSGKVKKSIFISSPFMIAAE